MRTVEEHARIVADLIPRTPVTAVPLREAIGLVLAEDLIAPLDLPPFANSAMDGYAVRHADLTAAPITLPVSADIPAGRTDTPPLTPGTAARIMTGAPLPDGADTIVQVEKTDGGTDLVTITELPPEGVHIRGAGEDVTRGTVVLSAGTVIGPAQVGVAAALGLAELPVHRRLTVLVLSTGSELVSPGSELGPGQIYESNAPMLATALESLGAATVSTHVVADRVEDFRAALRDAAGSVDLVVTSGGVSAGAYEVVKDALTGGGVEFAKVAMQPGMPQGAGTVDGTPVVTLPGNPVSSYVSFEVFLRPAVRAAMGHPGPHRRVARMPLAAPLTSPAGKRQFRRGVADAGTVRPWGGPGSHLLAWLAGADAVLVIEEDRTQMSVGDEVEVWLLT